MAFPLVGVPYEPAAVSVIRGPAGVIGGRSAVDRIPGDAAQTYGIALRAFDSSGVPKPDYRRIVHSRPR